MQIRCVQQAIGSLRRTISRNFLMGSDGIKCIFWNEDCNKHLALFVSSYNVIIHEIVGLSDDVVKVEHYIVHLRDSFDDIFV